MNIKEQLQTRLQLKEGAEVDFLCCAQHNSSYVA